MRRISLLASLTTTAVLLLALCSPAAAQSLLPNGSFEQGTGAAPAGWTLVGKGAWLRGVAHSGKRCLMVEGNGADTIYWRYDNPPVQPGRVYIFGYWYRTDPDAKRGSIVSGLNCVNDDHGLTPDWRQVRFAFMTPTKLPEDGYLRLGVWTTKGRAYFDDVELLPAQAINRREGTLELGDGERVDGTNYTFSHNFGGFGNTYARPLYQFTADFNSNRWVFIPGRYVVYRHSLPGAKITGATVTVNVNYYTAGTCIVEASRDGKTWHRIAAASKLGELSAKVPDVLLSAAELYIRLRSPGQGESKRPDSAPGSFQVNRYMFSATLDRDLGAHEGATAFLALKQKASDVAVKIQRLTSTPGRVSASLAVTNNGPAGRFTLEIVPQRDGRELKPAATEATVGTGSTRTLTATLDLAEPGEYAINLRLRRNGHVVMLADAGGLTVPELWDASFGYLISSDQSADLWWCEGSWKVARERPAPKRRNPRMYVEACRDEYEPVQLVVRPRRQLTGLRVQITDLHAPGGATIPADEIEIKQVEYVYIKRPTDRFGAKGWWPDPLPPVKGPLTAAPDRNLPLWLVVHVPRLARPGVYDGAVTLMADGGWRATVPLRLRVFSFSLPREFHIQTALGLSQGNIWRYHNITAPEDEPLRRKVWDLYMQNWREHHISPYQFWIKGFEVKISGFDWSGGRLDRTTAHSGKQCIVVIDDGPGNPSASPAKRIPVDRTKPYLLRFWAKTKTDGQEFMVTLGQFQAGGRWIPYNNIDLAFRGTTQWKKYEVTIPPSRFNPKTVEVDVSLRGSRWVSDGSTTGTTWFDDVYLGVAPDGPNLLPDPSFEKTPDQVDVTIDWTEWDRQARKYLDGYHFNSFRLPIMGLGGGRYPNYNKGRFGPFEFGTPEYERLMGKYLRLIQDHLEKNGWLRKAYVYWYDEPGTRDYPFVVERMKLLKRLAPKLTRMLTEQPEPPLYGYVDLWCPVLHAYRPERCQARQQLGERVWWYVCCGPKAPWLGLFIDHPHTDMRAWLWATWKWNVEGCLIWTTNWWTAWRLFGSKYQNPWEDPMSYTSGSVPGRVSYWGNGDGRFLYPPNRKAWHDQQTKYIEGPVDSYRWEQLRDGLEDWEYMYALQELVRKRGSAARDAARLLKVPDEIMGRNAIEFTHKPTPILQHRRKVAEAIERLMR